MRYDSNLSTSNKNVQKEYQIERLTMMSESQERANYMKNRRRGFKINRKGKPETKKKRRNENNNQAKVFPEKKINNKK
jgi:hypothetical protein